jgi:pimeloyl-ACP methyl ester carboxylesterase
VPESRSSSCPVSPRRLTFDDFAPRFTDRYRVIGITRRGWGRSSHAALLDYDSRRLILDIVAVMDSLAVPAAHVVGWSFGGHEAVLLAAEHPERVLSVTLLDSYDNSLAAGTFATSDTLPGPDQPPSAPPTTLREMVERRRARGFPDPVSELCVTSALRPTAGISAPSARIRWEATRYWEQHGSPTPP